MNFKLILFLLCCFCVLDLGENLKQSLELQNETLSGEETPPAVDNKELTDNETVEVLTLLSQSPGAQLRVACGDIYSTGTCGFYKRRGLCKILSFKTRCRSTCNFCPGHATAPKPQNKPSCKDSALSCKKWSYSGYCKNARYVKFMTRTCKFSCGICGNRNSIKKKVQQKQTLQQVRYNGECGNPKYKLRYLFQHRIVGGTPATYGTVPWQVAIFTRQNMSHCGGVLIGNKKIITAAHCFKKGTKPFQYKVYLGKYHQSLSENDAGEKMVRIRKIFVHERYNDKPNNNDIALIMLKEQVHYNDYIRPVCLPDVKSSIITGQTALVTGWGETKNRFNRNNVIQKVDVRIISSKQCNRWMSAITSEPDTITNNMVCAGYKVGGKDACQGDSGGPLIVEQSEGRHVLIGIVSWGFGCAKKNRPGVYTKIQNYIDWINMK